AYASAITSASCHPRIAAVLVDRLVDGDDTPPTGLYDVNGAPKSSVAAVRTAVASAQRGIVVCPGLAVPAAASVLQFPLSLSSAAPASFVLGCTRDCLCLATLLASNGRPVVARRAALRGGMPPATGTLRRPKLKPGTYR